MLIVLAALALAVDPAPYPSLATDAGFALDAGEHGQVIDASSVDAGAGIIEPAPRVTVHIAGTKVLPAEIYVDVVKLPPDARPDAATAARVQAQILAFLLRTGFELASVSAVASGDGVDVEINEGQVERVIFLGELSFQQIRFKLALLLPNDVFNRPLLDRQVRELSAQMGLKGVRWELIRTSAVAHVGPQVTQLPPQVDMALQGDRMIHERRPYEVHIIFPELTSTGLGIDIRSGYMNGLESGFNYRKLGFLFDEDRAYVATSVGVGARARIDTEKLYAHFSRAVLELHYDLFPLLGHLRPELWLEGELLSQQRADLMLENFSALTADAALQLDLEIRRGLHFLVGGGFEWRRIFGFEGTPIAPISADAVMSDRKRPFVRFVHESVLDPTVLRWDRRHSLQSEVRLYLPLPNAPVFAWVDVHYQFVHGFGWHDLWVQARGYAALGDITFRDELSVGELVRGTFGSLFVPAGADLQLEFRFSLTRDVLKVGLFNDVAVYAVHVVPGQPLLQAQVADGFGPAIHFLAQDLFQLDLYMAFGFRQLGAFSAAFSMQLQKAF